MKTDRWRPIALFLCFLPVLAALAAEPVEVKISVLPGLKYDVPRFAVAPGAPVKITLRNPDQMIHNLVITEPGARMEIVMAALALGAEGPAKDFVPTSPKVLFHTRALNPGESQELAFIAPATEGVYPYVCTFTGHGIVMYGAMYVTTKPLPPLESDPNLPPVAAAITDASDHAHGPLEKPVVSRTFLPDCGPAAIAVGFPGGQSFCFDAGLCLVRYAWSGGFVDNGEHWNGKGEAMGKVVGRIYYRPEPVSIFQIGDEPPPAMRWRGYEMKDGVPVLQYTANGHPVRLTVRPLPAGKHGLEYAYEIDSGGLPVHVSLDGHGGGGGPGQWNKGRGILTSEEARHLKIQIEEKFGEALLAYYSFNDLVFNNKKDPEPGVIGRAFTPGGIDGKKLKLDTGLHLRDLWQGGTLMGWVKLKVDPTKSSWNYPLFGVGSNVLFGIPHTTSTGWEHYAITSSDKRSRIYRNGVLLSEDGLPFDESAMPETITIGSAGETFFRGLIDEVRIYENRLSDTQIRAIYEQEVMNLPESERPAKTIPAK